MKLLSLLRPFFMFLQVAWVPCSNWQLPGRPMLSDRGVVIWHTASTGSVREVVIRPHRLWLSWELTWPNATRPGPPHLAPALAPGLAQISGDPAWLTEGTLPPPYLTLSRHWHHSIVQNTARFFGTKIKLHTGSFTINIPKILAYCCSKGSSKIFPRNLTSVFVLKLKALRMISCDLFFFRLKNTWQFYVPQGHRTHSPLFRFRK